jgi:UDP-GlcNAc:undecaprenyl-phosphate/decaprenyl-phosphate GlcNAc-1-phosphate transferase
MQLVAACSQRPLPRRQTSRSAPTHQFSAMYSLAALTIASIVASLLLTPFCRDLFLRLGYLDRPDNSRKRHRVAVPRVGGVAIAITYLGSFALLLLSPLKGGELVKAGLPVAFKLVPAAALVFATGLVDDLRGLKPWQKLLPQIVAALIAYWSGVHFNNVVGFHVPEWLMLPATVVWLVGCSNAFNLIDGLDGLAAGVGLFATLTTLLAALLKGNIELAFATVPLIGALLGFLRYNFNPASIFLGDCGSLLIGFLLGAYGVLWSDKSATLLGMMAPLMAVAIPLFDTGLAIVRRFLRAQPIFEGDRGHIHHQLLARGFTPKRAVMILYGVCGVAAALSLLLDVFQASFGGVIIVLFCGAAWIAIHGLGYAEFGIAGRMIRARTFQRLLNAHVSLRRFETELRSAPDLDACWTAIAKISAEFDFDEVLLSAGDSEYRQRSGAVDAGAWSIVIPLPRGGQVRLRRSAGASSPPLLAPLADLMRDVLSSRFHEIVPALSDPVPVAESAIGRLVAVPSRGQ